MSTEGQKPPDRPFEGSWWREHLAQLVVGILGAVVAGVVLYLLFGGDDEPPRPPLGTIDTPERAAIVEPDAEAAGRLRDVPADKHVWLAVRKGDRQWATTREVSRDQNWQIRLPSRAPRGQPLSLVLFIVGSEGNEQLRSAAGRVRRFADIPDAKALASVQTFYVKVPPPIDPLHSVLPLTREFGGEEFRFENLGGRVDAGFPETADCHRPERGIGLRLMWDMSGEQNGGWGVAWDHERSARGRLDASDFYQVSFSVKGAVGGETFEIGLKDLSNKETKVQSEDIGPVSAGRWTELVVPLEDFKGVDTRSIENLNIGFNHQHGSGSVCIDEIAFE